MSLTRTFNTNKEDAKRRVNERIVQKYLRLKGYSSFFKWSTSHERADRIYIYIRKNGKLLYLGIGIHKSYAFLIRF